MVAVLCYHKNPFELYKKEWIEQYKNSILNQTFKGFDLFELDYSGKGQRIFENSNYHSKEFPSFVYGLNYLLDSLFFAGYTHVFNGNVDDYYSDRLIETHLAWHDKGYELVANNFCLVKDDQIIETHSFDKLNLELELAHNHNIISHPSVSYSKSFWEKNRYVPDQQPLEDLMLWQRAIKNSRFIILPDVLLFHRLHSNSVCQSENR